MAYNITIDGIDRTSDVLTKTLHIEDVLNDKVNTCRFSMVDRSGNGVPANDTEIVITDGDGDKLFSGYVLSHSLSTKGSGVIKINLNCIDQVRLFDQNLVHKSYEDMTDAEIIADIVATYCPSSGITINNVIEGVTIDQISFNYVQPSQAMRRLCDITGRNWYIDYDKDIHYFPSTQNPAPFDITESESTFYINDDMTTTPSGTLQQDAVYDAGNDWVQLVPAANNKAGRISYNQTLPENVILYAEFYNGNNPGGADANWIWWNCASDVGVEDSGAGYMGYVAALDEYQDEVQLWYNGTMLTAVAYSNLDNNTFRAFQVLVTGNNIVIKVDGVTVLDFTDSTRAVGGNYVGVGARTGGFNNEHRVREFQVYSLGTNTDYYGLQIGKDASQLKNRVYVRGGTKLSDTATYQEKGDGVKKKFVLPDKPHDVSITVNGVSKSLGIKNIDTSGYDWYLNFQEKYLEQDSGGATLGTGDTLAVSYKYDIPILVAVEDTASIAASGSKEFAIFDKTITTTQAARDRATAELTDYANNIIEGSFSTFTAGFRSGQYIRINLSDYGVDDDYLVQKVTSHSLGGGLYSYDVTIASSKTMGIVRFLIELLEANRNLVELDDDEVVDELFSVTDSLLQDSLTDALTIDSTGPYFTWCTDSLTASPITRGRWDLAQWG